MKKNKFFLILFIIFLFASACFVHTATAANLEVTYPSLSLPGVSAPSSDCTGTDCLPKFVAYLFGLLCYLAGVIALISFTVGAVGLINPSPESHGDAKDRMKGAVLGLLITMASFVILQTINSNLTTLSITPLEVATPPAVKQAPGVYLYLTSSCAKTNGQDVFEGPITSSLDTVNDKYNGATKSAKIVNDTDNKIYYGAIFHEKSGLNNGGNCSSAITDAGCQTVSYSGAIDVFRINKNPPTGNGIIVYSTPYGWDTGENAGFYASTSGGSPVSMCFDYTNVDRPDPYKYKCTGGTCGGSGEGGKDGVKCSKTACETFRDCPGSIELAGSILVGLYSGNYCQTFTDNIDNLNAEPFIASGKGGTTFSNVLVEFTKSD